MTFAKSDTHLIEAVEFALANKPCIIACHTVKGMDEARLMLSLRGHTVSYIRVATRRECRIEQRNAFESGLADYLVIADHMLHVTRSRRVGASLAVASEVVKGRQYVYAQSIRSGSSEPEKLFFKERPRKEST